MDQVKTDAGAKDAPQAYVTQIGDTLATVAQVYYGDGSQAGRLPIYAANRDVIGDNMYVLYPGLTLTIPPPDQKWPVGVNRDAYGPSNT